MVEFLRPTFAPLIDAAAPEGSSTETAPATLFRPLGDPRRRIFVKANEGPPGVVAGRPREVGCLVDGVGDGTYQDDDGDTVHAAEDR